MTPLRYPHTPYLREPDHGSSDDRIVPTAERRKWLASPVVVEEKLDGANAAIRWDGKRLQVASRGGVGAMDRAGQLGPLRARVNAQYEALRALLDGGRVHYPEWLWPTHTVHYDRLPDHLVAPTSGIRNSGFAAPGRDERLDVAGMTGPPRLFTGVLGSVDVLETLIGTSRFGTSPMEGVVLRRADRRRCKVARRGFVRADDSQIGRMRNMLRWAKISRCGTCAALVQLRYRVRCTADRPRTPGRRGPARR